MQAISTGITQALELAAGVLDAGFAQGIWVVFVLCQEFNDRRRQRRAAHEDHTADLLLTHERHDACGDGYCDSRVVGHLAKAEEALIIKEKLRHEEARSGILLLLKMLNRKLKVLAGDMSLGVGGCAHAKTGVHKGGNEVFGVRVFGMRCFGGTGSLGQISTQGKDVLDAGQVHLIDFALQLIVRKGDAGQVRDGRNAKVVREHGGDFCRGPGVARATGGVGDTHEIGVKVLELLGNLVCMFEGELAFGREHFKRDGLSARCLCVGEDVGNFHGTSGMRWCGVSAVVWQKFYRKHWR